MNRGELRAEVRVFLNDPAPGVRWTDGELNSWLNQALTKWSQDTNQLEQYGTPTLAADLPSGAFYLAPSTFQAITRVQWQGRDLGEMVMPEYQTWETVQGTPMAIILGPYGPNKFRIFPYLSTDQSSLLKVYGDAFAASMSADSDVPGIPAQYHIALAYWAISRAYRKDSDDMALAASAQWLADYTEQVKLAQQHQPVSPGWVPMRYP